MNLTFDMLLGSVPNLIIFSYAIPLLLGTVLPQLSQTTWDCDPLKLTPLSRYLATKRLIDSRLISRYSGDILKILAISNVEDCAESIVEVFENSDASVVAKEEQAGSEELARMASDGLSKKGYQYAIVVTDNHIGADIALNKLQNVRAAVCAGPDDLKLAISNNANVIIVKSTDRRFDYLSDLLKSESSSQKQQPKKQRQETIQKQQSAPQKPEPKEEEPEPKRSGGGKGGIFGQLKDSLGIMDE